MYHPKVIEKRIELALRNKVILTPPEYHTRQEVERVNRQLDATRESDDMGRVHKIRDFTPEEIAWMRNERFLCRVDFNYFATRYAYIKNAFDQVVQFEPWVSQKILLDLIAEMERDGLAIMLILLKARQLGMSRLVALLVLHRLMFFPNVNAIMGSSTPTKTLKLLDMWEFVFDRLPFWMVPDVTARQRNGEGGFVEFGKMDSGITLQHGAQMTGIARGTTPTIAHLTELAEFDHPESIVDASLLRAMHDSPRTMLILEGTGEGYNWWYRKWMSAKEGWPERKSRLRPNFLPWFTGSDLYPTEAWLRAHPIPTPYTPPPFIIDHARKSMEYVQSNDLLTKHLGADWKMPVEQQWFYDVEYSQAQKEDRLNTFLQEMPASDDEAFQTSNYSVFPTEVINLYRQRVKNPVGVYGLVGPTDEVPPRLQPHYSLIDSSLPPIPITAMWGTHRPVTYQLVPLRWGGYSTDSGMDKIYLFEMPKPGYTYGLGIDTSYGVGKDRTTIEILRKGTPWECAMQVGEFCSDKINAMDATPFAMALGTLYSVPNINSPEEIIGHVIGQAPRQCRVAIECKGNGDQTQLQMRFRGWTNFHPWQRIDNKKLDPSQFSKIGVYTNEWFRAGMLEFMTKMLKDNELEICSPFFVREMASLESRLDVQKIGAADGEHDDRFFSLGFIVISLYQWEKDRPVSFSRPQPKQDQVRRYAVSPLNVQERPYGIE